MTKLHTPVAAWLLYLVGVSCFVLPLIFTSLQFDDGAGFAITIYYAGGFIAFLLGILCHLWSRSRQASGHKTFSAGINKDVVPHRLGETEE